MSAPSWLADVSVWALGGGALAVLVKALSVLKTMSEHLVSIETRWIETSTTVADHYALFKKHDADEMALRMQVTPLLSEAAALFTEHKITVMPVVKRMALTITEHDEHVIPTLKKHGQRLDEHDVEIKHLKKSTKRRAA